MGLNPEQLRAATHGDGPLLVIAGAGTGKTRTLAARVSHLLASGVAAERILLLTFSRAAAKEMISRLTTSREDQGARVWGGTFHAIAHRLLRIYAEPMGLAPGFTIMDRSDAEDLMDVAREALDLRSQDVTQAAGAKSGAARFPRKATCLSIYSRCVNADETIEEVLRRRFPWVADHAAALKQLFSAYEERKRARSVLDLDDLLVWWQGLQEDEVLGPDIESRFDHVLVDEYQDTNRLQRAILLGLRKRNRNLTVVGDDAQAIYGFRAATVRNILDFEKDWAGAATVRLEQNYRSTEPILAATNALMAQAKERHEKTLRSGVASPRRPLLVRCRDEMAEATFVVSECLARLEEGIPLRRQAVLFRTAHHSDLLEVELGRKKIPYRKYGGLKFHDAAHVKDLLAFLRVLENPADETAWFRILKLQDGVGPKTARRILDHLASERFLLASLRTCSVPATARDSWEKLTTLLGAVEGATVSATIDAVRAFYEPLLAERYDHAPARLGDLESLARLAQGSPSRRDFLADLTLDPPSSAGDLAGPPHLDEDWLVLSTVHSAKGLEWDAVSVLRAVDGCIPSDLSTGDAAEIEEERRIFYVALTRARRFLTVLAPLRFHVPEKRPSDGHVYAPLTRFLGQSVLAHFEQRTDSPFLSPDGATRLTGTTTADTLRQRALKRWQ
jgi:DNA helicase-2/ATP-dependent DNA helicase PcrA